MQVLLEPASALIESIMTQENQDIQYHAARLLVLIGICGSPISAPKIKGRTLLAKLDFFLRYPLYLDKALRIETGKSLEELLSYELNNVETRMIRYKYGPWDNVYYSVLAYLISKDLIFVELIKNVEHFGLTNSGSKLLEQIMQKDSYSLVVARARILKKVFGRWSGTKVKDFIYKWFPEVISMPIGQEI